LELTPKQVGWTELELRLKSANPDVAEVRYSIPVLVVPQTVAAPAAKSDKADPAPKANNTAP
jgi:hypothetical protein